DVDEELAVDVESDRRAQVLARVEGLLQQLPQRLEPRVVGPVHRHGPPPGRRPALCRARRRRPYPCPSGPGRSRWVPIVGCARVGRMGRGTGENVGFVRTVRAAVVAGAVLVVAVVSGCTVPSTLPDGSVPQVAPVGLNGMAQDPTAVGGNVWAADYFGHQLLWFDPDTGRIAERYGGLCDTDDVVVAPDGSLIATCAGEGTVVRVQRDGAVGVLSVVGRGVNPIALAPGGEAVVVGFGTTDDDRLLRVPLDGGPVEVVADGLPVLNGFGFGPDGRLYAPTGGVEALLGSTGGLIAIDVSTGSTEVIPLQFD